MAGHPRTLGSRAAQRFADVVEAAGRVGTTFDELASAAAGHALGFSEVTAWLHESCAARTIEVFDGVDGRRRYRGVLQPPERNLCPPQAF